jgi:hypothetical protein
MTFNTGAFFTTVRNRLGKLPLSAGQVAFSGPPIGEASGWRRNGRHKINSPCDPFVQSGRTYPVTPARSPETRENITSDCNRPKPASVDSSLFALWRPSTIIRRIVRIGIDAVDGEAVVGPFAHVTKKRDERGIPSFAHTNASPSPIREVFELRIVTSALHAKPRSIGRADQSVPLVAMLHVNGRKLFGHLNILDDHTVRVNP